VIEVVLNLALEFDRGKTDLYAIERLAIRIGDIYKKNKLVVWYEIKDDFIKDKIELTMYSRYRWYYYLFFIEGNSNLKGCYDDICQVINSFKFPPSHKYIWLS